MSRVGSTLSVSIMFVASQAFGKWTNLFNVPGSWAPGRSSVVVAYSDKDGVLDISIGNNGTVATRSVAISQGARVSLRLFSIV